MKTAAAEANMSRWRAMRFFMADRRLGWGSDGLFAPEKGDDKKDQKDEETDFGDAGGGTRDSPETENSGNKGDDDEGKGPGEHDSGGVLEFGCRPVVDFHPGRRSHPLCSWSASLVSVVIGC